MPQFFRDGELAGGGGSDAQDAAMLAEDEGAGQRQKAVHTAARYTADDSAPRGAGDARRRHPRDGGDPDDGARLDTAPPSASGDRARTDEGQGHRAGGGSRDPPHPAGPLRTSNERRGWTPQAVASKRAQEAAKRHARKLLSGTQP